MKKIVLLIVVLLAFASASMADQLWYISQSEAKAAVELLQKQKYVLLFCGCCDGDEMQYVKIEKVYTKTESGYYIVVVDGVDANGNKVSKELDLAYAHIQKKKMALCVGKALKLDCDPCVKNLEWQCPNF